MKSLLYLVVTAAAIAAVWFTVRPLTAQLNASGSESFSISDVRDGLKAITDIDRTSTGEATRLWTHQDGRRITATILGATKTTVTFRRASDAQVFTVSLQVLSEADRAFVHEWLAAPVR